MIPTHLIAIKVDKPSILTGFQSVMTHATSVDPEMYHCHANLALAHVPVMVLHVPTEEDEEDVRTIFQSVLGNAQDAAVRFIWSQRMTLSFYGVGRRIVKMGDEIAYAFAYPRIGGAVFRELLFYLRSCLRRVPGVEVKAKGEFECTLLNTEFSPRPNFWTTRLFNPEVINPFRLHGFGEQTVEKFQLLDIRDNSPYGSYLDLEKEISVI